MPLVTSHCSRLATEKLIQVQIKVRNGDGGKPDLPCHRLLFMRRNQVDGGHMTPQLTEVDLPRLSYLLLPPLAHIVRGREN